METPENDKRSSELLKAAIELVEAARAITPNREQALAIAALQRAIRKTEEVIAKNKPLKLTPKAKALAARCVPDHTRAPISNKTLLLRVREAKAKRAAKWIERVDPDEIAKMFTQEPSIPGRQSPLEREFLRYSNQS